MAQLNRDFLLKNKNELKKVKLEKYQLELYLRKLSVRQLKNFGGKKNQDEMDQMADAILYCCVDKDGNPMFDERDRDLLLDQGIDLINALFAEIVKFCNMGDSAIEDSSKN